MTRQKVEPTGDPAHVAAPPGVRVWTPQKIVVISMLTLIMLTNYLDRLIMTIVQEPMKLEIGMTDFQLGLVTGPAFGILYAFSALPIARLAERFDRVWILSVSLSIWSAFTALNGLVTSYVQLFLVRMGVGVSEGGGMPSVHSLVSDYFAPRQRGIAIAITGLSMPLAGFIAPLVGGFVAHEFGWRWAFAVVGVPGIVIAILFRLIIRDPRQRAAREMAATPAVVKEEAAIPAVGDDEAATPVVEAPEPSTFLADMKWMATNKAFVLIWLATATAATVMTGSLLFTASYLLRKFGLTLQEAGVVLSIGLGGGGFVGSLLGGWASDRFSGEHGQSYMVVPCIGAAGAGMLYYMAYSVDTWIIAGLFVVGASVFQSMKNGPGYAAIQTLVPAHMRATASAVLLLAISLVGVSVGPMVVGMISDWAATGVFPAELGRFAEQCHGSATVPLETVKQACAAASSKGLERALQINAMFYVVPFLLFILAAKHTRLKMD